MATLNPYAPIYIPCFHFHTLIFHRFIYLPPPLHLATIHQLKHKAGPPRRELRGAPAGLFGTTTTVMIKNVPNRIKRDELMKILDKSSGSLSYDFVYLPMDFQSHANYGYAFVNFTTPEAARLFRQAFHNLVWSSLGYRTKKICQIARAKTQGKKALMKRFKDSVFPCCSDEYLPVVLSPPPSGSRPVVTVIGKRTEPKPIIG